MRQNLLLWIALAALLIAPILLRPRALPARQTEEAVLVIVSPHNESIRSEFSRAFDAAYVARTGQHVRIDWRTPGGTTEIARYLAAEYVNAFQIEWSQRQHRPWSKRVETSFDRATVVLPTDPHADTPEQEARRVFLASNVGCGIDLFFGGGAYDFMQQANAGRLVDAHFVSAHPDIFQPQGIPQTLGGETFWDPQGRWMGCVLSAFGICANTDALHRLGIEHVPKRWAELGDSRFFHALALANPTQSGSVNKAFEMLIQQQIAETVDEEKRATIARGENFDRSRESAAVSAGWTRALRLLQRIGGNARYFTDSAAKVALDVEAGEAAAGMCIDFYGRVESEAARRADGTSRLQYTNALGGSSVGVDPIGLLRGAPHPEVAHAFLEFVFSIEGQKLWNWKRGTPGGPARYALRRLPILPQLYAPEWRQFRADPEVLPYEEAKNFTYHPEWTGALFRPIGFIVRVMCVDPQDELVAARRAILAAGSPPEAVAAMEEVSAVDFATARGSIREALAGDRIREVQLARTLADGFRAQYQRARKLAEAGH